MGIARRQRKGYGRSSIRGNQMNLGVPSATRFSDGLRSVFFKAPVPSGCTLTEVESKLKASIRMRTICSCCNRSNTGPRRLSWPSGSCAHRCYANCQSAWEALATYIRVPPRTRSHSAIPDSDDVHCLVAQAGNHGFARTALR